MASQEELKSRLIEAVLELWTSSDFALSDSDRARRLRPEIIERVLGCILTDDERAALLGLPEGCRIRESAKLISRDTFECGKYVWIGENAVLDASGGLEIGDHTSIGLGVYVWTHSSHLANLAQSNEIGSGLNQRKPTRIGAGCFIGGPAVIYPGVTIGDKCIIQPMSAVTRDVPPYSVVAGSPAVIIGSLSEQEIDRRVKAAQGTD